MFIDKNSLSVNGINLGNYKVILANKYKGLIVIINYGLVIVEEIWQVNNQVHLLESSLK